MHLGLHRKRMQNGYSPYGCKQYPPQHYRVTAILSSHRHPLSSRRMCVLCCRGQALVFIFFFLFLYLPKKSNNSLIRTENTTALQSQLCTFFTIACSLSKMMGLTLDVRACLHTTLLWNQRHGEEEGGGEVGERREGEEREVFQLASETFQGRCFKTKQFVIRPRAALLVIYSSMGRMDRLLGVSTVTLWLQLTCEFGFLVRVTGTANFIVHIYVRCSLLINLEMPFENVTPDFWFLSCVSM